MFRLKLQKVCNTQCSLGEGLFVKNSNACWVDINNNRVFASDAYSVVEYPVKNKPSVIFDFNEDYIHLGTDVGLVSLRISGLLEDRDTSILPEHSLVDYRSNDGGYCGGHQLLGFMHRENPKDHPGFVYRASTDSYELLENSIHIPNTFVALDSTNILISDSLKGQIWLYELDNGGLNSKHMWAQLPDGAAPDGGCMVGDYILIAFWDGAAIAVFAKDGELVQRLPMPVPRPTNCKFDSESSRLWVTSATEGLSRRQLAKYPNSGDTFVFDLDMI